MSEQTVLYIGYHSGSFPELESKLRPVLYRDTSSQPELMEQLKQYLAVVLQDATETISLSNGDGGQMMDTIYHHAMTKVRGDAQIDWKTSVSYSTPHGHYELVHANVQGGEISPLACCASIEHNPVTGPAYLIRNVYDLDAERGVKVGSCVLDDLVMIIRRRFYYTGIYQLAGQINKIRYQDHLLACGVLFGMDPSGAPPTSEQFVEIHGYRLLATYYRSSDEPVNEESSRLLRQRVRGPVFWCQVTSDRTVEKTARIMHNLSLTEFQFLSKHCYGTHVSLSGEASGTAWNRYSYCLTLPSDQDQYTCPQCQSIHTAREYACPGCLHLLYCSGDCRDKHSVHHSNVCPSSCAN